MKMNVSTKITPGTCLHCGKVLSNRIVKNRHMKRMHKIVVEPSRRCRIICPLCEKENHVQSLASLREHLKKIHGVRIEQQSLQFSSVREYDTWKQAEKIDSNYATHRSTKFKDHREIHYGCSRSDNRGYQPNYIRRAEKAGGSIKMHGICPSNLIVKIYGNGGKICVNFYKTHAGHDERQLRRTRLSTEEPTEEILQDAIITEMPKLDTMCNVAESLGQSSKSKSHHEEEVAQFVEEKVPEQLVYQMEEPSRCSIQRKRFIDWLDNLDDEDFERFMKNIQGAINQMDRDRETNKNQEAGIFS